MSVDDVIGQVLWTNLFLQAQGHVVTNNIIFEDNKSEILLEENGKASSSKQTRNMEIRYIFVKEKIASKLVEIHHCPTESMIAYFT